MLNRAIAAAVVVQFAVATTGVAADRDSWVLVQGDELHMSGSTRDARDARRAGEALASAYLWFRRGGQAFLVSDADTLRRAQELFAPLEALGRKQGALGKQQGRLGKEQGQLGRRQGRLGRQQADATANDSQERSAEMRELGEEQRELGKHQQALGEQQRILGEEQRRLAEAMEPRLQALFDEAIRSGRAKPATAR